MRGLLVAAALAALLPGCVSKDGGDPSAALDGDEMTMEQAEAVWTYGNFTASSAGHQPLGAIPYLVGGGLGPGAVIHDLGPRPEGLVQLTLHLEWTCANCAVGQELVLAVEESAGNPGGYTHTASGSGSLDLAVGADAWPEEGAEVYIVPRTGDMPVSPMLQVSYELTGSVVTVSLA